MKNVVYILLGFFAFTTLRAQQDNVPLHYEINAAFETHLAKPDVLFHTSVKPYNRSELLRTGVPEPFGKSVWEKLNADSRLNARLNGTLPMDSLSRTRFEVLPLWALEYGYDMRRRTSFSGSGAGASLTFLCGDKLAIHGEWMSLNEGFPAYVQRYADSMDIVPGMGYAHGTSAGKASTLLSGYVSYSPHRIFNLQAGFGRHFWGDGYRSLLLSDNAYNYPYLRLSATFWKVKYVSLFAMMSDIRGSEGHFSRFQRKYVSLHYLNWNIGKRVSLGLFEGVVWQARDTLLNRQFDVNYLNPFVFFRPVEYSLGSPDNMLLGLNLKIKLSSRWQFYGQAVFDEFVVKELVDQRGWWANKYGFQAGLKALEPFGIEGLQWQAEGNMVRPFTYSHGSVVQNYAHYNAPLAHPLGANFYEGLSMLRYTRHKFQAELQLTYSLSGADSGALSYGGNIFDSYSARVSDYGHRMAQGLRTDTWYGRATLSWVLVPAVNLRLFVQYVQRQRDNVLERQTDRFIQVGFSTRLWNRYVDW